jgi:hypothetical protein
VYSDRIKEDREAVDIFTDWNANHYEAPSHQTSGGDVLVCVAGDSMIEAGMEIL